MKYDLGIVLSHEFDEKGELGRETKVRVEEGLRLANAGMFEELVMSGGHLNGHDVSIASKMKDYALQRGTLSDISTEDISLDTVGQLIFLKEGVIDPRKARSFVLITHYWHSAKTEFMAYSFFDNAYDIQVIALEPEKYNGKRRWDFTKLPLFIRSFPPEKIENSSSLAELLIESHPWYNGNHTHWKFSPRYFMRELNRLKNENTR